MDRPSSEESQRVMDDETISRLWTGEVMGSLRKMTPGQAARRVGQEFQFGEPIASQRWRSYPALLILPLERNGSKAMQRRPWVVTAAAGPLQQPGEPGVPSRCLTAPATAGTSPPAPAPGRFMVIWAAWSAGDRSEQARDDRFRSRLGQRDRSARRARLRPPGLPYPGGRRPAAGARPAAQSAGPVQRPPGRSR